MAKTLLLHTAKTLRAIRPRSPLHRDRLVRRYAELHGWAYITVCSEGVRVVVASSVPSLPVGATHMDLPVYHVLEAEYAPHPSDY